PSTPQLADLSPQSRPRAAGPRPGRPGIAPLLATSHQGPPRARPVTPDWRRRLACAWATGSLATEGGRQPGDQQRDEHERGQHVRRMDDVDEQPGAEE